MGVAARSARAGPGSPMGRRSPYDAMARQMLRAEARALLTRIANVRPFALHMPMVTAAAVSPAAQTSIENLLLTGTRELSLMVRSFLGWLSGSPAAVEAQRRFNLLRLRFNAIIRQFDVFASVFAQRSEHETGVWVAGLDDVAADALSLPGGYFQAPPIICYLDKNHGAGIRRAYTRLPGGKENPVAVISVPRERMIGSGIASSLIHEVGHQAGALLGVLPSLRVAIERQRDASPAQAKTWSLFHQWTSEIFADFWSVARTGVGATLGLIGVVSLPSPFVFRYDPRDPHPIPWVRVRLSVAIGKALFPHRQWDRLDGVWTTLYPESLAPASLVPVLAGVRALTGAFVGLLLNHQPTALRGKSLLEVLPLGDLQPTRLAADFVRWRGQREPIRRERPSRVFAVLGQARADGKLTPEEEARILGEMLKYWALRSSMDVTADCAQLPGRARYAEAN
jgi:hypothetical protein